MKMNRVILAILLCLNVSVAAAEIPDIQEGLWEVSSEATIPGMPMKMPAVTMEQCFTKQSMKPENITQQNNCQMNSMDIQNNLAQWSMSCEQEGMTMQGGLEIFSTKKQSFPVHLKWPCREHHKEQ